MGEGEAGGKPGSSLMCRLHACRKFITKYQRTPSAEAQEKRMKIKLKAKQINKPSEKNVSCAVNNLRVFYLCDSLRLSFICRLPG